MRLRSIFRKRLVVAALSAVSFFLIALPARADDNIPGFVANFLASIAQVLIELVGKLLITLIEILKAIVQYNDFINAPAVDLAWVLVRDVANMAFLIIFITIAFATILGIEKYEYKQYLPKLLMMAVLINFSRTICGIVLDAAQVLMMTFVNGFKDVLAGNLIRGFGVTDMLTFRSLSETEAKNSGVTDSSLAAASILAVIMLVIATVTVGIIVIMLLVRVIYLWILIILSPLAFMLAAAPGFSGKFNEWWDKFVRYALFGPILAFFLWLSFSIMAAVPTGGNLAGNNDIFKPDTIAGRTNATITAIGNSENLLSFGIAIALLLMSLSVANEIGVKGGSLAGSALNKIQSGGVKLAKMGGLLLATGGLGSAAAAFGAYKGGRKGVELAREKLPGIIKERVQDFSTKKGAQGSLFRRALKYTTKEGREGFFARGKQKQRWASEKAAGQAREEADLVFSGTRQIPYGEIAEHKIEQELVREYEQFSKERFMEFAEKVEKVKGPEGQRMRKSVLKAAANKGYLDDIMTQQKYRERYKELGKNKYGYKDGEYSNDLLLNDFLYDYLEGAEVAGTGRDKASQDTMRVLDELEEVAKHTNHWEYAGHAEYDSQAGKYEATHITAVASAEDFAVDDNGEEIRIKGKRIKSSRLHYDNQAKIWKGEDEDGAAVDISGDDLRQFRWQNKTQMSFAIGEMNKLGARDKNKLAPHNLVSLAEDPTTGARDWGGQMTEFQRQMLSALGGETTREVQHSQARVKYALLGTKETTDTGAIAPARPMPKLEELLRIYGLNSEYIKNNYAMLANERVENISGFVFEIRDKDGKVQGERVFGDEGRVRGQQIETIKKNMQAIAPEMYDKPEETKEQIFDLFYQFAKIKGKGTVDNTNLPSLMAEAAARFQATVDNKLGDFINKDGSIKDQAAWNDYIGSAPVAQLINEFIQKVGDVTSSEMEAKFKGVGTNRTPSVSAASAAAGATPTPTP